uniref:Putative ovule protein n=1 Tax=Solanum chacoense TaxID=4108 RepID=A0A0V0GWN9_SOLCH
MTSLRSLISFWCSQKVPCCIDNWLEFVENHSMLILYILVYPLYTTFSPCFTMKIHLPDRKKEKKRIRNIHGI